MELKTTHLIIGGAVLFGLSQCQGLTKVYEASVTRQDKATATRSAIADGRTEAREQGKWSDVALERIKAGCLPVATNGKAVALRVGEVVTQGDTRQLVPDGAFVCNALGYTARIETKQGISTMADIAAVGPGDLPEFLALYQQLPGVLGQPPTPLYPPPATQIPATPTNEVLTHES
jgi:hypothetical protein